MFIGIPRVRFGRNFIDEMHLILVIASLFCCGTSLDLPPEFLKCKRSDPGLNECMKNALEKATPHFAKGFPAFGIAPSNPVKVPSLTIGQGTGVVHVEQKYKNAELYNLVNPKVQNTIVSYSADEFRLQGNVSFNEIVLKADYSLDGSILVLPISGEGKCTIKLVDVKVPFTVIATPFERKGRTYMKAVEFKIELFPKNVVYNFENLFNGDPKLGSQMNKILNENDMDVFQDVKSGYENAFGLIFKQMTNAIFLKVPFDIILPP